MRKVWCQKLSKDMMVSFECTFDFIDDDGNKQFCIDGYPEDENESGEVVATVVQTTHGDIAVVWHDNGYRMNETVLSLIEEIKSMCLSEESE